MVVGDVTEEKLITGVRAEERILAISGRDSRWRLPLLDAQENVFRMLADCEWEQHTVYLSNGVDYMNVVTAGSDSNPGLVVLHGFGTGLAFWARNLKALSEKYRVFLVDWIGCAGSSRPEFKIGFTAEETENFFVDTLYDWVLEARKLRDMGTALHKPFSILAHSMGGFLSSVFAEKHPDMVKSLVLACPVGIPQAPENKYPAKSSPFRKRLLFWVVFFLWGLNFTPQWFIRKLGPVFGRQVSRVFVESRFPSCLKSEQEVLSEYMYRISVAPASGEYAINHVLEPGAWARRPLINRLPALRLPIVFIYGDKDWMSWTHAEEVGKKMNPPAPILMIEGIGHHTYMEASTVFNNLVLKSLEQHYA